MKLVRRIRMNGFKFQIEVQINQQHNQHNSTSMSHSAMDPTLRVGDQQEIGLVKKQLTPEKRQIYERQILGDKILAYVKSAIWIGIAIAVIYYSNFFHHLFRNTKVNPLFFEVSVAAYTIIILLIFYITLVLPVFFGVKDIEEYNPKLIPIGAVTGVVAVISLLIAIWPVWGWTSLLIFLSIWKGFFSLSIFLPGGQFGNFLFLIINAGTILSFYLIQHEGYFH